MRDTLPQEERLMAMWIGPLLGAVVGWLLSPKAEIGSVRIACAGLGFFSVLMVFPVFYERLAQFARRWPPGNRKLYAAACGRNLTSRCRTSHLKSA